MALCKRTGRGEIFQRRLSSEGKMFLRWWQDERISGTRQQTPRDAWTTNVVCVVTHTWHVRGTEHPSSSPFPTSRKTLKHFLSFRPYETLRDMAWPPPGISLLHIPRTFFSLYARARGLAFRRTRSSLTRSLHEFIRSCTRWILRVFLRRVHSVCLFQI